MITAILLCGGSSSRMGFDKLFTPFGGKCAAMRSAELLFEAGVERLAIPVSGENYEKAVKLPWPLPVTFCPGGKERGDSVKNGLVALQGDSDDIVLIHDAARCFMPPEAMKRSIESAERTGSGVCALKVSDTVLEQTENGPVLLDRSRLIRTQTPQTFRYGEILDAYENASGQYTDDGAVYLSQYGRLELVEGSESGFKLTTVTDWERALSLCAPQRYGTGFDTHILLEGRRLILGGVEIPFEKGLFGHSDADVLLHAITDAVLGAAALGDIGRHFPDKDPRYKGIDSRVLLRKTREMLEEKGLSVWNVDATLIAQRPKLNPYFDVMRENIAADLNITVDRVSLKATTTEGMNDEGKGRCISAQAAVSVR